MYQSLMPWLSGEATAMVPTIGGVFSAHDIHADRLVLDLKLEPCAPREHRVQKGKQTLESSLIKK